MMIVMIYVHAVELLCWFVIVAGGVLSLSTEQTSGAAVLWQTRWVYRPLHHLLAFELRTSKLI